MPIIFYLCSKEMRGGGGIHDFSSINEGNRSFHPILGNEHIREWNGHSLIVSPLLPTKF